MSAAAGRVYGTVTVRFQAQVEYPAPIFRQPAFAVVICSRGEARHEQVREGVCGCSFRGGLCERRESRIVAQAH